MAFSPSVSLADQNLLSSELRVPVVEFHESYLGLPTVIGRNKKAAFKGVKDRLRKRLVGWKENILFKPGKMVLIKSVAQAIPTYTMSVFKVLASLCAEMNSLTSNYWWCGSKNSRGIHWLKWSRLCTGKKKKGASAFEIFIYSIRPCLQNKRGSSSKITTLWCIRY